jgi:late competence protein required for DNA uptake (superfamily II DNA/RNA helicase)
MATGKLPFPESELFANRTGWLNKITARQEAKMKCDRCNQEIEPGQERQHLGQYLCEDCCIDVLSPIKTCDPWAVHSAKNFEKSAGKHCLLTPIQSQILKILEEKGSMEPKQLLGELDSDIQLKDLEREFATLRHMEKVRGEKQADKILWRLW